VKYASLVQDVVSYEGTLKEPGNVEKKREQAQEMSRRTNNLVAFVKRWRAVLPYLCGLLGPSNDSLEEAAQRGDTGAIIKVIDHVNDGLETQREILKNVLDQSKTKTLVDLPCLCSPVH